MRMRTGGSLLDATVITRKYGANGTVLTKTHSVNYMYSYLVRNDCPPAYTSGCERVVGLINAGP